MGHSSLSLIITSEIKSWLLVAAETKEYPYSTKSDQTFNVTKFGYYVCAIKLEGANGLVYEDRMNVSANADEIAGYYHVLEDQPSSKIIELSNVPSGKYNKVTFTIGIPEEGVFEGAAGGIFDLAEGAWLWNWNSGYVAFKIEGGLPEVAHARTSHSSAGFAYHIGGWRDIAPNEGEDTKIR